MKIKEDAEILSSENEKIGRIAWIVMDPATREVTHLVAKKGLVFPKEKVIALDQVRTMNEDRVILDKSVDADSLPDFEETHHVLLEDVDELGKDTERRRLAQPLFYYPMPGSVWWGTEPYPSYQPPPYVSKKERNIPEEEVPLSEDAVVLSNDGEEVGRITSVYTEPGGRKASHFEVLKGLVHKERKLIPTFWVAGVYEDHVRLSVDAEFMDRLPPYEPK